MGRLLSRPNRAGWTGRLLTAGAVMALGVGTAVPLAAAASPPKPDKTLSFDSAAYEVTEGEGRTCLAGSTTSATRAPIVGNSGRALISERRCAYLPGVA